MSRSAPGSPPCASALHPLLVAQLSEAWRIDSDLLPTHLASLDHALRTHSAPRGALATSAGSRGVVPLLEPALAEISATYGRFEKAVGLHQDAAGSLLPLFRVDQRRCVVEWNCALQELTGIRCVCVCVRERERATQDDTEMEALPSPYYDFPPTPPCVFSLFLALSVRRTSWVSPY